VGGQAAFLMATRNNPVQNANERPCFPVTPVLELQPTGSLWVVCKLSDVFIHYLHRVDINHAPAPHSRKWLTDKMLNENPLFLCGMLNTSTAHATYWGFTAFLLSWANRPTGPSPIRSLELSLPDPFAP